MADPDPVEVGLERTRLELEELAKRLSPETPSESPPTEAVDPLNSTMACDAGYAVASGLGELFRAVLFRERPERLVQANQRPRSRFTSPTPSQAAAAVPPLRPAATAPPAPLPSGGQSEPPKTSGTPNTEMSFVGFLPIIEKAADSPRFPREYLEGHSRRLDIDDRTTLPRSKELKGPIVGGIIPSE